MALFKIFKGLKNNLPSISTSRDGYCYYTIDDSLFYVDFDDGNGLQRKPLNAGGIIETNKGTEQKFWRGTSEEYQSIEDKREDTLYIVTDQADGGTQYITELVMYDQINGKKYTLRSENGRLTTTLTDGQLDTFTITNSSLGFNGEYQFETGMTWEQWVNSEYNINGFAAEYSRIWTSVEEEFIRLNYQEENGNWVTSSLIPTDLVKNLTYYCNDFCCFEAGTMITTSLDGRIAVPIETLQEGDFVVSYNINTGENYLTKVKKAITNIRSEYMAIVILSNGTSLTMTDVHPLYTKEGFKSPRAFTYPELKIGDMVKAQEGWTTVESIEKYRNIAPVTTYTLNVIDLDELIDDSTNDNFYANGIVAHNKC